MSYSEIHINKSNHMSKATVGTNGQIAYTPEDIEFKFKEGEDVVIVSKKKIKWMLDRLVLYKIQANTTYGVSGQSRQRGDK